MLTSLSKGGVSATCLTLWFEVSAPFCATIAHCRTSPFPFVWSVTACAPIRISSPSHINFDSGLLYSLAINGISHNICLCIGTMHCACNTNIDSYLTSHHHGSRLSFMLAHSCVGVQVCHVIPMHTYEWLEREGIHWERVEESCIYHFICSFLCVQANGSSCCVL